MYEHQGLAWAVASQAIIRLYRRCMEARPTPQGLEHKQEVISQATDMADTCVEAKTVLEHSFAVRLCSALRFTSNLGIAALSRLQDQFVHAITAAGPREAKHKRVGFAEWVERILNQQEGYRPAHNWTRGTPKAPPLPTSGTYGGVHY
eukprot:12418466-Karenia_brevis.AAC.1